MYYCYNNESVYRNYSSRTGFVSVLFNHFFLCQTFERKITHTSKMSEEQSRKNMKTQTMHQKRRLFFV